MANGKIRFGKQSGGKLALVFPDGVTDTEVTFPESGELATKKYVDDNTFKLTGDQTIAGVKTFTTSPIVPTPTAGTQATNKQYVDDRIIDRIGLIDYGYTTKPYYIVAYGGEYNRADYPKLWAYLQSNPSLVKTQAQWQTEATANGGICGFFSDGDGTTTFRVPNLDAAFLRPSSRGAGSYQADTIISHSHAVNMINLNSGSNAASIIHSTSGTALGDTGLTGGTETRPKNIAVLPLIVAK